MQPFYQNSGFSNKYIGSKFKKGFKNFKNKFIPKVNEKFNVGKR